MSEAKPLSIVIISGSHRKTSQSRRVSDYLASRIEQRPGPDTVEIVDLSENPLPLWSEEMWSDRASAYAPNWAAMSASLDACDGVIVVSPEWGGMAPSGLKNLFLMCKQELAHKPGMLVGVSSTRGGCYPVAELRVSSYKNTRLCYIPENIILRDVEELFHGPEAKNKDDAYLRGRIDYSLGVLSLYAHALRNVRGSSMIDLKAYPFGM